MDDVANPHSVKCNVTGNTLLQEHIPTHGAVTVAFTSPARRKRHVL
jgi:hypothetical protein